MSEDGRGSRLRRRTPAGRPGPHSAIGPRRARWRDPCQGLLVIPLRFDPVHRTRLVSHDDAGSLDSARRAHRAREAGRGDQHRRADRDPQVGRGGLGDAPGDRRAAVFGVPTMRRGNVSRPLSCSLNVHRPAVDFRTARTHLQPSTQWPPHARVHAVDVPAHPRHRQGGPTRADRPVRPVVTGNDVGGAGDMSGAHGARQQGDHDGSPGRGADRHPARPWPCCSRR